MATFIIILFALAIWHFTYQSIILPTLQLNIRVRLKAQRDKLRELKSACPSMIEPEVYHQLEHSINNVLRTLPILGFGFVTRMERDHDMAEAALNRASEIETKIAHHSIDAITDIRTETIRALVLGTLINHGGWIITAIPIVLTMFSIGIVYGTCKKLFDVILFLPSREVENITIAEDHLIAA